MVIVLSLCFSQGNSWGPEKIFENCVLEASNLVLTKTLWLKHYYRRQGSEKKKHFFCSSDLLLNFRVFKQPPEGRSLRTRPHKRVTLVMVGFFTIEATTFEIKHFRRWAHSNGKHECFWQRSLQPNSCFMGRREEKLQTLTEPAFGWVLIGWVGRSVSFLYNAYFLAQSFSTSTWNPDSGNWLPKFMPISFFRHASRSWGVSGRRLEEMLAIFLSRFA